VPSRIVLPARLRPGDAVALVAPAGPVPAARLADGLSRLAARYDLRWSRRIYENTGYLAGSDRDRITELMLALADPAIRAVVCARGGYGIMRILPGLDPELLRRNPKPLVGFSDITALHAWAAQAGVASVHGPVATQLGGLPAADREALFGLLEGATGAALTGLRSHARRSSAEGPLYGGNLELITRLVGTPYAFPLEGAVLLIEEIGERPYRIDRSLTQLHLSGALDRVAAVLIGDLVRCEEPDGSGPTAAEVVQERLGRLPVPVLSGLPVGHGERNHPLGLGVRVRVDGAAGQVVPLDAVTA
jgi:muramoyltetrapeptide carboxypeptidase